MAFGAKIVISEFQKKEGMTNFIPVFPLELVVYPGEKLNLHIFEPRYKQMVKDCLTDKKHFGIPPMLNGSVAERGTLMQVVKVVKEYEDGRMDIQTEGIDVFRILEIIKEVPEKLYQGAIVNYAPIKYHGSKHVMNKILTGIRYIQQSLNIHKTFPKPDNELIVYDVAHLVGLSLQDEYAILEFEHELHRQEFLKRKIEQILPAITQVENIQKRAAQNGHFKNLEGFNL